MAYIIDVIIQSLAALAITIILAIPLGLGVANNSAGIAGLFGILIAIAWFAIGIGYFPYFWAHGGQTPGMRPFNLRVVRDRDGGPVSGGQAILRIIGLWVGFSVFYLGVIWIFIDSRRRGWQDLIGGTVVVEIDK